MKKLSWLGGASLTLYVISGQRNITEELAYVAGACVIIIVLVVVSIIWPLIFSRNGRTEVKQSIGTLKVRRGPFGLFGTGEITVTQKTTYQGYPMDVKAATGSVMPDKLTPTGYASGFDFGISWKTFFVGVFCTLVGVFCLFVLYGLWRVGAF
ncbi:hypothetical protein COY16_02735 [Candidatus Roizmanbacteria bacterium CG_4_10_14_0_2_um_filter_39_13]|uniref:Uncharacterized protein n=1 Tax=Candidatus Roizmanbacteria bacterium CG_4_10_14_0_2_um_filter_39_13 TaxID=1974825 RepID=A0A2M7TZD4_9BACT|nr:MAG: hypothetical protein COY16_02735 [Candidatus Roizmanbacteria bacterium CG_4_10_14_0_2_um_filter_39_13]